MDCNRWLPPQVQASVSARPYSRLDPKAFDRHVYVRVRACVRARDVGELRRYACTFLSNFRPTLVGRPLSIDVRLLDACSQSFQLWGLIMVVIFPAFWADTGCNLSFLPSRSRKGLHLLHRRIAGCSSACGPPHRRGRRLVSALGAASTGSLSWACGLCKQGTPAALCCRASRWWTLHTDH